MSGSRFCDFPTGAEVADAAKGDVCPQGGVEELEETSASDADSGIECSYAHVLRFFFFFFFYNLSSFCVARLSEPRIGKQQFSHIARAPFEAMCAITKDGAAFHTNWDFDEELPGNP